MKKIYSLIVVTLLFVSCSNIEKTMIKKANDIIKNPIMLLDSNFNNSYVDDSLAIDRIKKIDYRSSLLSHIIIFNNSDEKTASFIITNKNSFDRMYNKKGKYNLMNYKYFSYSLYKEKLNRLIVFHFIYENDKYFIFDIGFGIFDSHRIDNNEIKIDNLSP